VSGIVDIDGPTGSDPNDRCVVASLARGGQRTRAILADRLSFDADKKVDAVLSKVIAARERISLEGWFN